MKRMNTTTKWILIGLGAYLLYTMMQRQQAGAAGTVQQGLLPAPGASGTGQVFQNAGTPDVVPNPT